MCRTFDKYSEEIRQLRLRHDKSYSYADESLPELYTENRNSSFLSRSKNDIWQFAEFGTKFELAFWKSDKFRIDSLISVRLRYTSFMNAYSQWPPSRVKTHSFFAYPGFCGEFKDVRNASIRSGMFFSATKRSEQSKIVIIIHPQ